MLSLILWPILAALALAFTAPEARSSRRIALRVAPDLRAADDFRRFSTAAERRGIRLDAGDEEQQAPEGWEVLRVARTPASAAFARRIGRFPIVLRPSGFAFDGREYPGADDAVALSLPAPASEVLVLGNTARAARRLTASILWGEILPSGSYRVVSSELKKEGAFRLAAAGLAVDRASDRDEIADRERFYRGLRVEKRGAVTWRYPAGSREPVARWQRILERHAGDFVGAPLTVVVFPETIVKARYAGSSRPADLAREGGGARLEIDASAPAEPDLVSPALASAAASSKRPALLDRPLLLLAEGARRHGRWWGREVRDFAAFTEGAGVSPSVPEVMAGVEELSPVIAVGSAASWLHAGAVAEGERAVESALAGPPDRLSTHLERWAKSARALRAAAPPRRTLPSGFLRGISYAMTNRVESSYASPRSLETLRALGRRDVNSISIMPFAFSKAASDPEIGFIHRHPAGETDEGTVLAVTHARQAGMSAMLKPQIWLGGGAFVGEIAMENEEAWRAWFADYRRFIVHNAVVAEAARADLFCVGTELSKTEVRERQWRDVIAAIRLATGAPLLYASNWAAGAVRVPFWDALDAIGVDFYDPLSANPLASDAELVAGARRAYAPVGRLASTHRKPVVFTEAGYPPVRGAWMTPHEEPMDRPLDPQHAGRAIAAVFAALEKEPAWKGVYWWKVFSDGEPAAPGSRDHNLLGRDAERAVATAYARIARARAGEKAR
ncbi:MAG: hypothetical protein ABR576_14165 [Thermoanaerobaculia bacterium]